MKWEFAVLEPSMWSDDSTWVDEDWQEDERMVLIFGRATDTPIGLPYHGVIPVSWHWIKDDLGFFVEKAQWMLQGCYASEEKAFRRGETVPGLERP